MIYKNITTIKDFVILGFPGLHPTYYGPASALLFFTYLVILAGNIFILVFVGFERRLQKPTYLIFCHLAMNDFLFGTVTLPKIISRYWWDDKIASFGACFTQMYFVHSLGAIHSLFLLIMALDRFIAICLPLKYPVLITNNSISIACGMSWIGTFVRMMAVVLHALSLPYCSSNIIVQCYCDHISITNLACGGNVKYVQTVAVGLAMFSLLLPLSFIFFSYISIFIVVLRIPNVESRYKTLSTCTPQLFISCLYYLPRCFVYLAHATGFSFGLDFRILLILLYSLLPPAVNPIIYCLKTKDIKEVLMKRLKNAKVGMKQTSK
ncbi:olfactory receptor 52E8-like [Seriola lalandi dorsalis]|uniref:Olfactory receptor 52E8-like n=1 Tax=Seriola lalandi dorsalis TaxID=1841481 RepID=A0A3B4WSQ1_SERLL|nr:olfactory receptor 52E8-like [Seriola lalandi dorsalis]XP_056230265.1 olfactory receptor 52E8-like [Seriola aureovittata]